MNFITDIISEYGLLATFIIIMLEYACFPVSSEIVLPFSGAVASLNHTNFLVILSLSILAGLVGTGICYMIGRVGGGAIIHAITHRFPKTKNAIAAANEKFKEHGAAAVCVGRVIPLIRTYIALIAGEAKLNPVTYFTASALGITIWNTLLIGLGFTLQENYQKVASAYERYKYNLIPVAGVCIAAIVIHTIYQKKKKLQLRKKT